MLILDSKTSLDCLGQHSIDSIEPTTLGECAEYARSLWWEYFYMRAELLLSVYRYGAAVNEDNLVWDHPLCILKLVSALTLSSRGQFKNFTPSSLSLGIVNNLIEFVFFPMIPTILMCRVSSSTDISLRFCY